MQNNITLVVLQFDKIGVWFMTEPIISKITLAEAIDVLGMTPIELARKAGVSSQTVMRATVPASVSGWKFATNYTCAELIAKALGLNVDEIEWVNGVSNIGRPAQTGVPIGVHVDTREQHRFCSDCTMQLPASGVCDCA